MRIGIVGAGYMGRSYANVLSHHAGATLAGIADANPDVAAAVEREFGVPVYASTEALLDAANLDGLIVATYEHVHREPSVAALQRGVGVLIEKPIASTVEDAVAIIEAARASGAVLLVGHLLRFDARYAMLQEAVQKGQIGQPLTVYARRWNGKNAQDRLAGRSSLSLFLGVHDFDIVRWTLGSEVVHVVAEERRGFLSGQGYEVADAVTALLRFANGTLATIDLGWVLPKGRPIGFDFRLEVLGTAGSANVVADYSGLSVISDVRESWVDTALWPRVHDRVSGALERETNHFVSCLRGDAQPLVTGEDGLRALQIALAVDQSASTGTAVALTSDYQHA